MLAEQACERACIAVNETTEYIHLATHGISSGPNPLDGSFLVMASDNPNLLVYDPEDQTARMDDRLTAREISTIKFWANPLIVLSACETGLGKDFLVCTMGLARAWHWAGASSVVVSLWNIEDAVTKGLMMKFAVHALEMPPDQALQKAMKEIRIDHKEPALWAGFTIFGGLCSGARSSASTRPSRLRPLGQIDAYMPIAM